MANKGSEHDGHRDRLRQRFEEQGLDSFAPHEVLELLLYYSIPRVNTNVIAHRLIERFGSISNALEAPKDELVKVRGIGECSASLLRLIPDLCRYYQDDKQKTGVILDTTEKAGEYCRTKFIGRRTEATFLVCLDNRSKVLQSGFIAEGTVSSSPVEIRKIVEIAMRVGAVTIILAHNHPKGFAIPSTKDIMVTKKLMAALSPLEITLIDHIIVADAGEDYVSMNDSGALIP